MHQSIGSCKTIRPLYIVKSQLNILTPVGTAIAIVVIENNELTDGPSTHSKEMVNPYKRNLIKRITTIEHNHAL